MPYQRQQVTHPALVSCTPGLGRETPGKSWQKTDDLDLEKKSRKNRLISEKCALAQVKKTFIYRPGAHGDGGLGRTSEAPAGEGGLTGGSG